MKNQIPLKHNNYRLFGLNSVRSVIDVLYVCECVCGCVWVCVCTMYINQLTCRSCQVSQLVGGRGEQGSLW